MGGKEIQEGKDIGIHIADSFCCAEETNTTLQSNYTSIKNKKLAMHVALNKGKVDMRLCGW